MDRFNKLAYQVGSLQSEILSIKQEIGELKKLPAIIEEPSHSSGAYKLPEYDIPIKTLQEFIKFDEDISNDIIRRKVVRIFYYPPKLL